MFTARTFVPEGIYNNSIAVKICKHVHGKAHLPVLHTMKMNDLLMHVTTWMSLRRLILSQSEDIKQHCISRVHLFKAPVQPCLVNRMTLEISVP